MRAFQGNLKCKVLPCSTFRYVEEILRDALEPRETLPRPTNGRLLWRIEQYSKKLRWATENDGTLFSPVFHDREYGYTLRVELLLNGKGRWKNRNMIGCVRAVDGEWDALLEWPCILRASVTLRSQENPLNNLSRIVKSVKSKECDNDCDLYMFIPHSTLEKSEYVKEDVLFLDVQVKDLQNSKSSPSLLLG